MVQVDEYFPAPSLSNYRTTSESIWQIEQNKILTNLAAPLKIRYVKRISDTGLWDALFVETFACRLAVEICERLTQSGGKRELAWNEYQQALRLATRSDAIENPPEPIADDAWILSRL